VRPVVERPRFFAHPKNFNAMIICIVGFIEFSGTMASLGPIPTMAVGVPADSSLVAVRAALVSGTPAWVHLWVHYGSNKRCVGFPLSNVLLGFAKLFRLRRF
jgi:hypothetical protein